MDKWWKNAVGYQIYIRTYKDSNDDGMGDLKGIEQKLDYIKSLGVDFIWICPFYDSPMDDNGYDIRDYYNVDKTFGTNADLKSLVACAHKKGIKVLMDLVMNHTSDENEWFRKSVDRVAPYTDYYIWKDAKIVDGKKLPPNNWVSFFSGSAWGWNEKRGQYFLKIFSKKMPDLNFENENAFREMEKVIEHYGKLHIDGFRVDAIAHIGKDLTFADAKNPKKTFKSFSNLENTHQYLKRFHKTFDKYNLVSIGELGGEPTRKDIMRYTTEGELDVVFSFEQMGTFNPDHTVNVKNLQKTLKYKEKISKDGGWSALFWLNHDHARLVSKVRAEKDPKNASLCLATLMYFLKGTPVIYNGEEIGMENYPFASPKDFKDVNAKMLFENTDNIDKTFETLKETSRDNSRTIMQWDKTKYAGFSAHTPHTHLNKNYKTINVHAEEDAPDSMLNEYRRMLSTRKSISASLESGKYKFFNHSKTIGYKIKDGKNTYFVMANFGNTPQKLHTGEVLYSNMATDGDLKPLQVVVLKQTLKPSAPTK